MPRPATTLILIKSGALARADFSAGAAPQMLHFWHAARPAGVQLFNEVESILSQKACGGKVWILCEDLSTQTVSLPASAVAGLENAQVARALCFEAEPLSGIPAIEAAAAFQPLTNDLAQRDASQRAFWVTVIESPILERIQAAVKRAGGRLAGMVHPAGVPFALDTKAGDTWKRVEFWNQMTMCVAKAGPAEVTRQLMGTGAGQGRIQPSIARWLQNTQAPHSEWLGDDAPPPDERMQAYNLAVDSALSAWLNAWARHLNSGALKVPAIAPVVRPLTNRQLFWCAIAAEAVIIALCYGHSQWITRQKREIDAELAKQSEPAKQLAQLTKKTDELKTQFDTLHAGNQKAQVSATEGNTEMTMWRARILQLIKNLGEQRPDDLMIQSIVSDGTGIKLKGICLEAAQADELASRLELRLRGAGWEIHPAEKQGQQLLENGGPYHFSMVLTPAAGKAEEKTRAEIIDPKVVSAPAGRKKQ